MPTKSHPINDGFLARETERLELLKATYSLRADGTIFRDRGDGWKRVVLLSSEESDSSVGVTLASD